MIHGFIYNPRHLGTLGEYFSLKLFPNSFALPPTSPPRNARRFEIGFEQWANVGFVGIESGSGQRGV